MWVGFFSLCWFSEFCLGEPLGLPFGVVFFREKLSLRPFDLLIIFGMAPIFWGVVKAVFTIMGLHVTLFRSTF